MKMPENDISPEPGKEQLDDRGALLSFLGPGILEVLDSLPFYVLLVDENHRILLANKATREHLGLEPQEITGEFCPKIVHGLENGESYPGCPLEEAVRTQKPVEREHFDDEHGRWMKIAMYPTGAWTVDGKRMYFHMIQDITDQKQTEESLKECDDLCRRLKKELRGKK